MPKRATTKKTSTPEFKNPTSNLAARLPLKANFKKMNWEKFLPKSSNQILVVLLVIAAFLIGVLVTKVQYLEKNQTANNNQQAAPAAQNPQQTAPAPGAKVDVSNGKFPLLGKDNAKVTIVEFADFRCPFCEKFFTDTESQIIKDYVDTGKVKFAFRNFAFLGPASIVAANAAECANEQGKFWEFHDYLYKNQPDESDTSLFVTDKLTAIAGQLGMNTDRFSSCLSTNKYDKNASQDLADGQKAGVSGTPTVFINGISVVGAQPYSAFKTIIDQELAK